MVLYLDFEKNPVLRLYRGIIHNLKSNLNWFKHGLNSHLSNMQSLSAKFNVYVFEPTKTNLASKVATSNHI